MGSSSAIAITVASMLVVLIFVFIAFRRSGAFGPSKAKRELADQLVQTGHKARAMVLSVQPTGTIINHINLQCVLRFRIEPLQGGIPFEGEKTTLIPQTAMPRIGDLWPCWFDPMDHTKFAVGQPSAISPDQIPMFREFGIPHPLDQYQQPNPFQQPGQFQQPPPGQYQQPPNWQPPPQ